MSGLAMAVYGGGSSALGLLSCKYGGAVGVTFPEWDAESRGERSSTPSAAMTAAVAPGPGWRLSLGLRLRLEALLVLLPLQPPPGGPGMCHKVGGGQGGGMRDREAGKRSALGSTPRGGERMKKKKKRKGPGELGEGRMGGAGALGT